MQNLYNDLEKLLKQDERLFAEDKILKNKVSELAIKLDTQLIELLFKNKQSKEHFFIEVVGKFIFNQDKFLKFINNKEFLPDSFTAFKNHIGLAEGDEYLKDGGKVVLAWPYKDCILEGGQDKEDIKRNEIFYNEILAPDEIDRLFEPKVLINFKKIDKTGEHKIEQITEQDNLIIKGNNLLALHSLKKKYRGKVKLVYVDPPYNTEGEADTFAYNNRFKHSTWLTFIKNRLEIAKEMLREDGFIAITIDHFELFYLGALADEIFGRGNRLGVISIVIRPQGRQFAKFFSATTEYMLVYAKNEKIAKFNGVILDDERKSEYTEIDKKGIFKYEPLMYSRFVEEKLEKGDKYYYPIFVSNDFKEITLEKKRGYIEIFPINKKRKIAWRVQQDKFRQLLIERPEDFSAIKDRDGNIQIFEKYREEDGTKIKTHWIGKRYNATTSGTGVLKELFGEKAFSYPKALYAVLDTIKIMTNKNDIILDFFAGSATTAHAVLDLNKEDSGQRRFILCEQLDYADKITMERVKKVIQNNGTGSFVYMELAQWNEKYMQAIQKAKTTKEMATIYKKTQAEAFFRYEIDLSKFDEKRFEKLDLNDQKKVLLECLDKNHLYVNYSEIEDTTYKIQANEKKINKIFYGN